MFEIIEKHKDRAMVDVGDSEGKIALARRRPVSPTLLRLIGYFDHWDIQCMTTKTGVEARRDASAWVLAA